MAKAKSDKQSSKQKKPRVLPPHLWKPGQSGNPKGRPKKSDTPYADIVRSMLAARGAALELSFLNKEGVLQKKRIQLAVDTPKRTLAHAIAVSQLQKALKGDLPAIEALINRAEGKPLERTRDESEVPAVRIILSEPLDPEDEPDEEDEE